MQLKAKSKHYGNSNFDYSKNMNNLD